jgi:hypothetical protein
MSKIHMKTGDTCIICCDELKDNGIIMHKTRRQTHKLCLDCCYAYLTPLVLKATENIRNNIRHNISHVSCPGSYHGEVRNRCKRYVDLSLIEVPKKSKLYTDIFRISYVLENPNVFTCPNKDCGDVIETDPIDPELKTICHTCGYIWCRNCQTSPYHDGMSCMEKESLERNTPTGKLISEKIRKGDMKFCPQCRAPTEKIRNIEGKFVGCNKIYCTNCGINWCWFCKETYIEYNHFNPENNNNCSNKLWEGVEKEI